MNKSIYMNASVIDFLHRIPVFKMFTRDELCMMLRNGDVIRLERHMPHRIVIKEGTCTRWVYVLLRGTVKVVKDDQEIFVMGKRGEIIGEIGALQSQECRATIVTVQECIFIAINIEGIEKHGRGSLDYLHHLHDYFTPLIEERLNRTLEITDVICQIREKRQELEQLEKRLQQLGGHEKKSLLQSLLEEAE